MPQTLELQIADAGVFLTVLVALVIFPSLVVFALEFKKTPAQKIVRRICNDFLHRKGHVTDTWS